MEKYRYEPLEHADEIRLLVVQPDIFAFPDTYTVHCKLIHRRLNECPSYEALSYAWGTTSKPKQLHCDGRILDITNSLWTALYHLRYSREERIIWADAVCINQSSASEKNQQLPLMGRIYSQSARTLCWIGKDAREEAQEAFILINQLIFWIKRSGSRSPIETIRTELQEFHHIPDDRIITQRIKRTISPIFKQAWFTRLWVVQEFVLSRKARLVFRYEGPLMDELWWIVKILDALPGFWGGEHVGNFRIFDCFHDMGVIKDDRLTDILGLLRYTENFECTDRRDRIYALLGIADIPGFEADYGLSLSQTYVRFAKWILEFYPDLRILSYARGLSDAESEVPSWAPSPQMDNIGNPLVVEDLFHADIKTPDLKRRRKDEGDQKYWNLSQNGELCIQGYIIDTVEEIVHTSLAVTAAHQYREGLLRTAKAAGIKLAADAPVPCDKIFVRYALSMTMGFFTGSATTQAEQASQFYQFFHKKITTDSNSLVTEPLVNSIRGFQVHKIGARRFCRTKEGRLAWIPYKKTVKAKAGDSVAILRGARVPYVLRKVSETNYVLVGECWLEHNMQGECLSLPAFGWQDLILT
jgi:hypothetical protein